MYQDRAKSLLADDLDEGWIDQAGDAFDFVAASEVLQEGVWESVDQRDVPCYVASEVGIKRLAQAALAEEENVDGYPGVMQVPVQRDLVLDRMSRNDGEWLQWDTSSDGLVVSEPSSF